MAAGRRFVHGGGTSTLRWLLVVTFPSGLSNDMPRSVASGNNCQLPCGSELDLTGVTTQSCLADAGNGSGD
jgi:hypothetical protein